MSRLNDESRPQRQDEERPLVDGPGDAGNVAPSRHADTDIRLFDLMEVRRKLRADGVNLDGDDEVGNGDARSNEEMAWERQLWTLLRDSEAGRRRLLFADDELIERIYGLLRHSPHFADVIGLVGRAAKLSHATRSPLAIPPVLLLGNAGIGKSFFARWLADAIGTHIERVAMDVLSDRGVLTGLSMSWKGARTGRIASALLASKTASPVFLLDEVDKISPVHQEEKPLGFLHTVLEPENARFFKDEYLTVRMRADHAIWILTANHATGLSRSILDRLIVFTIPDPGSVALKVIVSQIYAATNQKFNGAFDEAPNDSVVEELLSDNPRTAGKLLQLAFGFAADDGRSHLTPADVVKSRVLLENSAPKVRLGFT